MKSVFRLSNLSAHSSYSSSSSPSSITYADAYNLNFSDQPRIAGETLSGWLDVNEELAKRDGIQSITLKFVGAIETSLVQPYGHFGARDHDLRALFPSPATTIWSASQTSSSTASGSPQLSPTADEFSSSDHRRIPFHFHLSPHLPPTFSAQRSSDQKVRIAYFVCLDIEKNRCKKWTAGTSTSKKRIEKEIIVRRASQKQESVGLRDWFLMQQGNFEGPWKSFDYETSIRQGVRGSSGKIILKLELPDFETLPVHTPIPFNLTIASLSMPNSRSNLPSMPSDKASLLSLFPPAADQPKNINLRLLQNTEIMIDDTGTAFVNMLELPTGFGENKKGVELVGSTKDVLKMNIDEPEWNKAFPSSAKASSGENFFTCNRKVRYSSTLSFDCPPRFGIDKRLVCRYFLELEVSFPSSMPYLSSNIKATWPVPLVSGFASPPHPPNEPGELCLGPGRHPTSSSLSIDDFDQQTLTIDNESLLGSDTLPTYFKDSRKSS